MSITLRPADPADRDFLYRVYAGTRMEELAPLRWDEARTRAFLEMQFTAQDRDYRRRFPGADFQIIAVNGEPVGRLYVDRRPDEIRIIDIALLPEHRGAGTGGALLEDILEEAAASALPVRIHVERNNPALRLYQRLGFARVADNGVYFLMERAP